MFVNFGDRGFWAYDIVLGVFLKYLIDVAEAPGISHAPFLDEALQQVQENYRGLPGPRSREPSPFSNSFPKTF